MANKPKKPESPPKGKTEGNAEDCRTTAQALLLPEFAGLRAITAAECKTDLKPRFDTAAMTHAMMDILGEQAKTAQGGDLKQPVAMLMNQAVALQSLSVRLTEMGMNAQYVDHLETYLKLALKAQNQCRMTLETLATIQNPPVVYARQANIAQNQQINNGLAEPSRTREKQNPPNELLEHSHGERLEFGTAATAGGVDPPLETVGAFHGA
jgi:hypothetical protein